MQLILMLLAVLLIGLRAFGVTHPRVETGWLGLALWALAQTWANLPT